MSDMPRELPQFVYAERTRHGRIAFYFRRGKGPRTRLPDLSAPDFIDKYHAALTASGPPPRRTGRAGSLQWLIEQYRANTTYQGLSIATRKQRDNIFKQVVEKSGHEPFKSIGKKSILAGREQRKQTPAQSRHFLDAMRGLFEWAVENLHLTDAPTAGVKNPPQRKGDGFKPWTQQDVDAFEHHWRAGTKERVWMHVLLYTGLRRGDAVHFGRQHIKDGFATLRTEKTDTEVTIPIAEELEETLDHGPTGDLAFICGVRGEPLTKESFGNLFREACNAAGVTKSAHGLRKTAAEFAAEAGSTVSELDAMFGWEDGRMASHYTKNADRRRLARQAAEKLKKARKEQRKNEPAPHPKAAAPHPKKRKARSNG